LNKKGKRKTKHAGPSTGIEGKRRGKMGKRANDNTGHQGVETQKTPAKGEKASRQAPESKPQR